MNIKSSTVNLVSYLAAIAVLALAAVALYNCPGVPAEEFVASQSAGGAK